MKVTDLKGKKITVMGLGLHGGGIGAVRFLSLAGAKIIVTDIKSREELAPSLEKLKDLKNITYILNQHRPEDFSKVDMVIKNPAASWNNKYIKLAMDNKIPVESDSSLFFKMCKNPIIGVTGTKGKTTTSSLIYEILKLAGKSVIKVGVGQTSVLDKLKELKKDTVVVFELSSWRLSALGRYKLSPQIAVVTNIYQDHLNYYKSMVEYITDKKYIFSHQKIEHSCILNGDNEVTKNLFPEVKSQLVVFSCKMPKEEKAVYIKDGSIYSRDDSGEKVVMKLDEVKMRGQHNVKNILAAIAAVRVMGIDLSAIKKGILNFQGVAHRLELVRELEGVKYYNDTAATTPESAIAGINSFREPIILICGGSDKNLDMNALAEEICEKVRGVIFLKGLATDKLIQTIRKGRENCEVDDFRVVETMDKAVELARLEAKPGEIVLLSPGAASFGLFKNEFDRGDKFKEVVKSLK